MSNDPPRGTRGSRLAPRRPKPGEADFAERTSERTSELEREASVTLARLFDRNHRVLFRVAARVLGDASEAEDVVQESFLRAATRLDRLPATESGAQAWLVRVAVNLCRDRQRRGTVHRKWEHRDRQGETSEGSGRHDPGTGAADGAAEARLIVGSLLDRLPTRRRAVLVLHELEGWNVAEIAGALGLRKVTVRWHLSAARRDLARWLETSGPTRGGRR